MCKKISPGNYIYTDSKNREFTVRRLEEGNYKGYWMVQLSKYEYSEPVFTKREAVHIAKSWG